MTEAIQSTSFRQRNSVFYLDNPASDGNLVVTFNDSSPSQQAQWILGLYALNGTATGVGDTVTETHNVSGGNLADGGPTVTVTESDSFVLNLYARNNGNLELDSPIPLFTEDVDVSVNNPNGGNLVGVFASAIVDSPGDYSTTVTGIGGTTPAATMVGVVFEAGTTPPTAIPEPSSIILLSAGGLSLVMRRRRK